jgi:hypothetical protein
MEEIFIAGRAINAALRRGPNDQLQLALRKKDRPPLMVQPEPVFATQFPDAVRAEIDRLFGFREADHIEGMSASLPLCLCSVFHNYAMRITRMKDRMSLSKSEQGFVQKKVQVAREERILKRGAKTDRSG